MSGNKNLKTCLVIWLILLTLHATAIASEKIIYVDNDATGLNDGSSWQNAYKFLQDALADANSAAKANVIASERSERGNLNTIIEIRVAQGTYRPDEDTLHPDGTGDRTATFQLINGVTLKGGYASFGQPDPDARNMTICETILSGDLDGNDVKVSDPCDLLNEPTRVENSFHVVSAMRGINETSVLDGFVITSGNANGEYYPVYQCLGGGMYVFEYSSPLVKHCIFTNNSADYYGGGMSGNGTLIDCKFIGNAAQYGGGVFGDGRLTDCEFIGNWADYGGGVRSNGTIMNCTFIENYAGTSGGGMSGGGTLTKCVFIANSSGNAAGALSGCGTLINCVFSGNTAGQIGGAIDSYCYPCEGKVVNCTFTGNSAGQYDGAFFLGDESNRELLNSIIWGNFAPKGSQVTVDSNYAEGVSVNYCNIQGGKTEIYGYGPIVDWGDGNIDADPCFVDPNNGDYHLKSQAGRWDPPMAGWIRDDVTSLCIDAGDPASPIGLEPFPNGGIINMGAYGGTAEASKSYFGKPPCETVIAGDINGDCAVNFKDFALMAFHWLEEH